MFCVLRLAFSVLVLLFATYYFVAICDSSTGALSAGWRGLGLLVRGW